MSARFIIWGIIALIFLGSLGAAKYLYDQNQELKTEKAILEADNAKITNQANRYANRPRTPTDTDNRLCAWARSVEASNGKPKRGVPVRPCP